MKYSKYNGIFFFCIYFVVLLLQRDAIEASLSKVIISDIDTPFQMSWTSFMLMSFTGALMFSIVPYVKAVGVFVILLTKTMEVKYSQIAEGVLTAYWFMILGVLVKLPIVLSSRNMFLNTSILGPIQKYFSNEFSSILIRDTDIFIVVYLIFSVILVKRNTKVSTIMSVVAVMIPYFLLLAFNLSFNGLISA